MQVKNMQTKKRGTRWHHHSNKALQFSQLDMEDLYVFDTKDCAPENTVVGMEKVATLKEIYHTLSLEVIQDVLFATKYEVDAAAAMLSEMVVEQKQADIVPMMPLSVSTEMEYQEEVEEVSDFEEEEEWTIAVAPPTQTRNELQQWIMVQDEWEVLDDVGEKIPTFAEVLKSRRKDVTISPSIPAAILSKPLDTNLSDSIQEKKIHDEEFSSVPEENEYTIRSLGIRKRKALRMRRR
jgi:hypothetical protein